MFHNETVNVWSHLIGALCFVVMIFYVLLVEETLGSLYNHITMDPVVERVPRWPIILGCCGAIIMLSASWYFHLYYCQSEAAQIKLQRFDYAGIAIMIASSVTPCFYYGFMCH